MNIEKKLINEYFVPLAKNKESLNLTNDAALIKYKNKSLVVSSDMMIEGTHFYKDEKPELIAKKLIRVNLSDLAATGSLPYGYILNISVPKSKTKKWLKSFCEGLGEDQKKYGLKLFGGDFSQSDKVFLSITIFGTIKKGIHSLSNAKSDSNIYVSGFIGDAIIGFLIENNSKFKNVKKKLDLNSLEYLYKRHKIPNPKLNLGKKISEYNGVCTDISDGLIIDLEKISNNSKLRGKIFLEKIPLSEPVKKVFELFDDRKLLWNYLLTGGEDYELVFSFKKKKELDFKKKYNKEFFFKKIGFFSEGTGINVFDESNKLIKLKKIGYSHF